MQDLKVAVSQFQPKNGDKEHNLATIEDLTSQASKMEAHVISFHELSITAYTFLSDLEYDEMDQLAEEVPDGPSCKRLLTLAKRCRITILAGLLEREQGKLYNTYVCIDQHGLKAKYRKIHPFISRYLSPGDNYQVFNILDWKCGILICYDNNIIENVRATALLGADVIFAPHVTGCTPSPMPGRGFVDDSLWHYREQNPEALRKEFDGRKGREWLLRWLPARAYDNGVYYIFTNPIGYDGDQLKNGNSMILDPFGDIMAETRSFDNEIATATLTADKLKQAGGYRYRNARKPDIYKEILGEDHKPVLKPVWMK